MILGKGTASGITLMMTAAHTSTSVRAATTAAKAADSLSLSLAEDGRKDKVESVLGMTSAICYRPLEPQSL